MNIKIDDPELEKTIVQNFGNDPKSIAKAFSDFIFARKLQNDVRISVEELDADQGMDLADVMRDVRGKYE